MSKLVKQPTLDLSQPFSFDSDESKAFQAEDNVQRIENLYIMLRGAPAAVRAMCLKKFEEFTNTISSHEGVATQLSETEVSTIRMSLRDELKKLKKEFSTEKEASAPSVKPPSQTTYQRRSFGALGDMMIVVVGLASMYAALTLVTDKVQGWDIPPPIYDLRKLATAQSEVIGQAIQKLIIDSQISGTVAISDNRVALNTKHPGFESLFDGMSFSESNIDESPLVLKMISVTKFRYDFVHEKTRIFGTADISDFNLSSLTGLIASVLPSASTAIFDNSVGTQMFWNAFAPSVALIFFTIGFTKFMNGPTLNGWKSSPGSLFLLLTLASLTTFTLVQFAAYEPAESLYEFAAQAQKFIKTYHHDQQMPNLSANIGGEVKGMFAAIGVAGAATFAVPLTVVLPILGSLAAGVGYWYSTEQNAQNAYNAFLLAIGTQALAALAKKLNDAAKYAAVPFLTAVYKAASLAFFPTDPVTKNLGSRILPGWLWPSRTGQEKPGRTDMVDISGLASLALARTGGDVQAAAKFLAMSIF